MMKLAREAQASGKWDVELCDGAGNPIAAGNAFVIRSNPGGIAASAPSAPGFVRLKASHTNWKLWLRGHHCHLELHGSLQWIGRSNAKHECDISVLPAVIGDAIRGTGGGRPSGLPVVAIECKDKVSHGTPDEMRQTLARLFDLAHVSQTMLGGYHRIFHAASMTSWGRRSSAYRSYFASGHFGIVRVGAFQRSATRMAQHYYIGRYFDIYDPAKVTVTQVASRFLDVIGSVAKMA
ncbi:hypothetical protein J4G37_03760 [Microvirga sp. 3-52]|nr:hypothetical protein [Microvirga sp. 3-52]